MSYIYYLILVVAAWLVLNTIYLFRKEFFVKKNMRIYYGFVLVYRKMSVIKTNRVFLKKIMYMNIVLFTLVLILFYYGMITSIMIKTGFLIGSPAQLLVPGVNVTGVDLVFFIIAIALAATVHELMHAHTAVTRGVRVKSIGFALIFILPVAFTEVDEEDFRKTSSKNRVLVLSAGPASNYLLALLTTVLLLLLTTPTGLAILEVQSNSLAEKYGLKPGDIILKINDTEASTDVLTKTMSNVSDTYLKLLVVSNRDLRVLVVHKPGNTTKLGVRIVNKPSDVLINTFGQYSSVLIILALTWLYIVNLGLAIINAAPIFISDGGRIFYELFRNKSIGHIVNAISLLILVLGVAPLK